MSAAAATDTNNLLTILQALPEISGKEFVPAAARPPLTRLHHGRYFRYKIFALEALSLSMGASPAPFTAMHGLSAALKATCYIQDKAFGRKECGVAVWHHPRDAEDLAEEPRYGIGCDAGCAIDFESSE